MAQDLFFIPIDTQAETGFDRALVTGILSKGAASPVVDYVCVYPDGSGGEVSGIDPDTTQERLSGLGFGHFGGRTMMERIFDLADALDAFLAWSDVWDDEPNACVTRWERLARVGEDAKAAFDIVVARDASHLNQLVKGSTFEANGW